MVYTVKKIIKFLIGRKIQKPRNFLESWVLLTIVANGFRGESWYYLHPLAWRYRLTDVEILKIQPLSQELKEKQD